MRHTSQYFEPSVYAPALAMALHFISHSFPDSHCDHTYVDNAVLFVLLLVSVCLWLLNLLLKVPPVDPMYFLTQLSVLTSA